MSKKSQKQKAPVEKVPAKKVHVWGLLLHEFLQGIKRNKGGILLTAVMVQLMAFLMLMAVFIDFGMGGDTVFGTRDLVKKPTPAQGTTAPATNETQKTVQEESKAPPLILTSLYAAYAVACVAGTVLFRRTVARRSFRILLYLQVPGLFFALYAVGRLIVWWTKSGA
jgi:hypothetical protein